MGISGNYRLDAFAARLSSFDGSVEAIEGLASLAANRPPRDWVDRDVDAARVELAALSREFLRTEGLAHVQGRGLGRFSFALFMSDPARSGLLTSEITLDGEDLERGRVLASSLRAVVGEKVGREVALAAALELAAALTEEMGGDAADDAEPIQVAGGGR
jgi:predicted ArsR family transcriptional regulator